MCRSLYENVVRFLETHLNSPKAVGFSTELLQDEALLQHYAKERNRYTAGAHYANLVLAYLNRDRIKQKTDQGRMDVCPV